MSRSMDNIEFIQERENESGGMSTVLSGWESVVFQVEDEPAEEE
jgi:hypothetical protein